jgi:hypothetical protein
MKAIDTSVENANSLQQRGKSQDAYAAFDEAQNHVKEGYSEIVGHIESGEIGALRKDANRVEVVPSLNTSTRAPGVVVLCLSITIRLEGGVGSSIQAKRPIVSV